MVTRFPVPLRAVLVLAVAFAPATHAAIDVGSDGSDGAFNPTCSPTPCTVTIDLSQAACDCATPSSTCPASDTSPDWCTEDTPTPPSFAGSGVYDRDEWAVVFKYASVNVPSGVTVKFTNHPSRAPVVWLVDGDVTIAGTVSASGAGGGSSGTNAEPGPGGFRGGPDRIGATNWGSGFGPAGGRNAGWHAGYGTPSSHGATYGNSRIVPLWGGSGGAGGAIRLGLTGGAGGGAILVAADGTVDVGGNVSANGGSRGCSIGDCGGAGSGGGIRIVAESIAGGGSLRAIGGDGAGGSGRIRLEARTGPVTLTNTSPPHTAGPPCPPPASDGCAAEIWPEDLAGTDPVPTVRITQIDGNPIGADPRGRFEYPDQDVRILDPDPVVVTVEANRVPATWNVSVQVTPRNGQHIVRCATETSRVGDVSTWEASVAFPNAFSAVQVRASQDTCTPLN